MTLPQGGTPPPINDETLSAWVDGALSEAEREAVSAAMARDPALAARARDLRATVGLLRALPQPMPRRTFALTPEMAATVRPARTAWFVRFLPTVTAVSAVAAVLCLALFLGDLRTHGFRTASPAATTNTSRAVPETVPTNTVAVGSPRAAATSTAAPAAAGAVAPAVTGATAASSGGAAASAPGAPPAAAILPAPTVTGRPPVAAAAATAAPTAAATLALTPPPPLPTAVAAVQATAVTIGNAAPDRAPPHATTRRVPLALVRTGEIALLLLFLAALAVAIAGWQSRRGRRSVP